MKQISTLIIAFIMAPMAMFSQTEANDTDFFKAIFGVDKVSIVKDFIEVSAEQNEKFWSVYAEYEAERKELKADRIALITDYAENYESFTDEKLDELCKKSIKQNANTAKLIKKYYKKLRKAGGSKPAAQFIQLENYFLSLSRTAVSENIPFIGELDKI